jgi:hypothetical protein
MVAIMVCSAQPRYIGTTSCPASFWVDSAGVSNHATLFENSIVETEGAPAKLLIEGGVRILLDAHSRAHVDSKHLVLERGRAQLDSGNDYKLEARTIRVSLAKPPARAIVSVGASGAVEVAALGGTVHVANAEGVAVANVAAGSTVELRLGQASEAVILTGSIVKAGAAYTLRDEASAVTVELRGTTVATNVGRRVQVSGTIMPAQHALAGADQVVVAKTIQVMGTGFGTTVESAAITGSRARSAVPPEGAATPTTAESAEAGSADGASGGGTAGTAGTASAAGTASTAGAAGASTGIGVSTAVIAGVAVAAAAGTAAAVVATQSHKPPISPGR